MPTLIFCCYFWHLFVDTSFYETYLKRRKKSIETSFLKCHRSLFDYKIQMQKKATECYATETDIKQFMGEKLCICDPTKLYGSTFLVKSFIFFNSTTFYKT